MRISQSPPTLLSLLSVILSSTHTTHAKPYPRDELILDPKDTIVEKRQCANPCGWSGQLCCAAGQQCFTDSAGQAQCGTGGGAQQIYNGNSNTNGQWQLFTTTYVETDFVTRTSTYSSLVAATQPAVVVAPTIQQGSAVTNVPCSSQLSETPCGGICCAVGQRCAYQGQCVPIAGNGGDVSSAYLSSVLNTASLPIRPTSNGVQTVTSTGATTTVAFTAPTATSGGAAAGMQTTASNNGLSGGAIAGIVIGVLLGIALLLLLCALFCAKGLLDGFLALIGLGPKKRRREETYIEERHSTHGGGGGRRWWGTGRPSRIDRPKKSGGGLGGFTAVAAGLGALALFLGLKRRTERRDKSSYGTGSSYSYTDYSTSASKSPPYGSSMHHF